MTEKENIYTIPNLLTVTRILAIPPIIYFTLHEHVGYAVMLYIYAGATDVIDGTLARRWNQQTVLGSILDPAADKLLMMTLVGTFAYVGAVPGTF
jgi:cardiolipin synthase